MTSSIDYGKYAKKESTPDHEDEMFDACDSIITNTIEEHEMVAKLREFLDKPKYIPAEKNDIRKNFWEIPGSSGQYKIAMQVAIPDEDIHEFMDLAERVRLAGAPMSWLERPYSGEDDTSNSDDDNKQPYKSSCIMLDFDIEQDEKQSKMSKTLFHHLKVMTAKTLTTYFEPDPSDLLEDGSVATVFSTVNRKPFPSWNGKKFKDGLHIYIFVRLTRSEKKFLIKKLEEDGIIVKVFEAYEDKNILDTNSAHAPPFLYGSSKHVNTKPKISDTVYRWCDYGDGLSPIQEPEFLSSNLNLIGEFSVNHEYKLIKKRRWRIKPAYKQDVELIKSKVTSARKPREEVLSNTVKSLLIKKPDAQFINTLVECIPESFYKDPINGHGNRWKIIYSIINEDSDFEPIAELWYLRTGHYDIAKWQDIKNGISTSAPLDGLKIDYINNIVRRHNRLKYESCLKTSIVSKIVELCCKTFTDGKLQHTQISMIAYMHLRDKLKADGVGREKYWFEFKIPGDKMELGEVYKWKRLQYPNILHTYISDELPIVCEKVLKYFYNKITYYTNKIAELKAIQADTTIEEKSLGRMSLITKKFKTSVNMLGSAPFKASVISESHVRFSDFGFSRELDNLNPMLVGVGNGVLELSDKGDLPNLITGYHDHKIGRYTPTIYEEFDPTDPLTQKILKILRSQTPHDETDQHEYLMHAFGASLDGKPREALLFIIRGGGSNGKSWMLEMIVETLGQYATVTPISLLIDKEVTGESASPQFMKLSTSRLTYYEEAPAGSTLNMAVVKKITGGAKQTGRKLYGDAVDFEPRCHHFLLTNHLLNILTHEEATWRRLRLLHRRISFYDKHRMPDDDKYARLKNPELTSEFYKRPDVKKKLLSILVFYNMSLHKNYEGRIENVPHPTIDNDTLDYRNSQDTVNKYICERIIKVSTPKATSIGDIVNDYMFWLKTQLGGSVIRRSNIADQFLSSSISSILVNKNNTHYLADDFGLMSGSELRLGESMFKDEMVEERKKKQSQVNAVVFHPETDDEYVERIKREWERMKSTSKSAPFVSNEFKHIVELGTREKKEETHNFDDEFIEMMVKDTVLDDDIVIKADIVLEESKQSSGALADLASRSATVKLQPPPPPAQPQPRVAVQKPPRSATLTKLKM